MVVTDLIYLPRKIDGHTTGYQRVTFYPKDHSLQVTSRYQQIKMTPQDPIMVPMSHKNALLLALSTFVSAVGELIEERYWFLIRGDYHMSVYLLTMLSVKEYATLFILANLVTVCEEKKLAILLAHLP